MTGRLLLLLAAAFAASAEEGGLRKLEAWFPDGTGIEFTTETTGSTPLASHGGGAGVSKDSIFRQVSNKSGAVLYEYFIEAFAGPQPGAVTIRIKPVDARTEPDLRHGPGWPAPEHVPTPAAVREFPGVKKGQAVRLEILYNPSTGEKIYDILRPSTDVCPYANGGWGVVSVPAGEEMSFREIALFVNGEKLAVPAGPLAGAAARLYLPGRGAYFLSANQPKTAREFQRIVYVDRHNLEFAINGDFLRITSAGNVLTHSETGILWVYHDPKYQLGSQLKSHPDAPDLVFADNAESLLSR